MIRPVGDLSEEEISRISHDIADAFYDYPYAEGEKGMRGFIRTREAMYQFMRGIFSAGVKSHCAYQSENGEAYMIMTDTEGKQITFWEDVKSIISEIEALGGIVNMMNFAFAQSKGGTLDMEIAEHNNAPHLDIEILVVLKQYWHKGFMRPMMNYAYQRAEKFGIMVALETDDPIKAAKYVHCGMVLYRVRDCGPGYHVYELIR